MKNIIVGDKKVMSLYKHNKRKLTFWSIIFVQQIYSNLVDYFYLHEKIWSTAVMILLMIPMVISLFCYLNSYISYKIEKDDELSKDNMNKAHASMSGIFLIIVALLFISNIFWKGSITVTISSSTLVKIALPMLSAYYILESSLFMLFEGKISDEDELEKNNGWT